MKGTMDDNGQSTKDTMDDNGHVFGQGRLCPPIQLGVPQAERHCPSLAIAAQVSGSFGRFAQHEL